MDTHDGPERLGIENKEHYTYQVRMLIDAFNDGQLPEVEHITVEPRYGYIASLQYADGGTRIIYGHDPGFNTASSDQLAKDKGYSKFILRTLGLNCPKGDEFLLPWWAETLQHSNRHITSADILTTGDSYAYIDEFLAYPVYVKPVSGSQGMGVTKVYEQEELDEVYDAYQKERVKVALVEESLQMPDYRLLVFDGELVNAYERRPLSVTGDGQKTVAQLIQTLNSEYQQQDRAVDFDELMPQIVKSLGRSGLTLEGIVKNGQALPLLDVSNLSKGGTPIDIMSIINEKWVNLATKIAKGFNLRICGIDLACQDITAQEGDYSVIEVNASPGAKHFMASAQDGRERLQELFIKFFRTSN